MADLRVLAVTVALGAALAGQRGVRADDPKIAEALARPVLEAGSTLQDVTVYCEERIPRMPAIDDAEAWKRRSDELRADVLDRVVFRGEAAAWRDDKGRVERVGTIPGGPGYSIAKIRYEALPDLWIPALLYEPIRIDGRVPVVLNVNGHDPLGKAADYKQIRCINLAKRGMVALNVEWFGMGQLKGDGYQHPMINAIDLCGTSGVSAHFLAMARGLDVLLAHDHADPSRVAVTGLSGGGWQTIFFGALDPRVTLTAPVAGYSSFLTRTRHYEDLGDSEQTPCDLATAADYTHLTAMIAPRSALLTFNARDNCCFAADHALDPLLKAARPAFERLGVPSHLRSFVGDDPGDHNYGLANRLAFYAMVGDTFYPGVADYPREEIACASEVKSPAALHVPMPEGVLDLAGVAARLSSPLPRPDPAPADSAALADWASRRRNLLREIVRARDLTAVADEIDITETDGLKATTWRLRIGDAWAVPAVELAKGDGPTTIVVADAGKAKASAVVEALLAKGGRVVAVDPFNLGESHFARHDYLWNLMVATVGDRPLGVQASQVAAVARWARNRDGRPVALVAEGPRSATIALVAAAIEPMAIGAVTAEGPDGGLKGLIGRKASFADAPEQYCFGLLEHFDLAELRALVDAQRQGSR